MSASGVWYCGSTCTRRPLLQVALDVPLGAHQDAVPIERPVDRDLAVVGRQVAAHLDRLGAGALAPPARQPPHAVGLFALADADAVVLREVVRNLRHAALGQVGRRRAQQPAVGRDVPGDHARIRRRAEADADIERVVGQRRRVHRQLQLDLHLRMLAGEARDQRRDDGCGRSRASHSPAAGPCGVALETPSSSSMSSISPRMRRACSR